MEHRVPYLTEDVIEREASVLLAQFSSATNVPLALPIPVEQILESQLRLSLDLDDLHEKLGVPVVGGTRDILGALWVDDRSVFIDTSLDPDEYPAREGRFRYTVGHEIGHWQLHRDHLPSHENQPSLFEFKSEPTIVCRVSQAKEPIEWQADFFAACLLMPRAQVLESWKNRVGDLRTRIAEPLDGTKMSRATRQVVEPLAQIFQVSLEAMRIRLEQLRLLQPELSAQPLLRAGA